MFFARFALFFFFYDTLENQREKGTEKTVPFITGNFKLRGIIETEGRKEKERRNNNAVVGKMSTELGIIQHGKLRLVIMTFGDCNIYCQ